MWFGRSPVPRPTNQRMSGRPSEVRPPWPGTGVTIGASVAAGSDGADVGALPVADGAVVGVLVPQAPATRATTIVNTNDFHDAGWILTIDRSSSK